MKYIGIVLILLSSILFGRLYSEKAGTPVRELGEFLRFLRFMKERVACYLEPPSEIARDFSSELLESLGFLGEVRRGAGLASAFLAAREKLSVSDEDKAALADFFDRSGRGYLDAELKLIDSAIEKLERSKEKYGEHYRTRARGVRVISAAFGLGISILLI